MYSLNLVVLLILSTLKIQPTHQAHGGAEDIKGKYGTYLINSGLSQAAKNRIIAVIDQNQGKIKAEFTVTINEKVAEMRIDMVAPQGRQAHHQGKYVPHAQVEPFKHFILKGGENKLVGFTPRLGAIQLTSQQVLDTFSQDGTTAEIAAGSDLYRAIKRKIGEEAMDQGWKPLLWKTGEDEPPNMAISSLGF